MHPPFWGAHTDIWLSRGRTWKRMGSLRFPQCVYRLRCRQITVIATSRPYHGRTWRRLLASRVRNKPRPTLHFFTICKYLPLFSTPVSGGAKIKSSHSLNPIFTNYYLLKKENKIKKQKLDPFEASKAPLPSFTCAFSIWIGFDWIGIGFLFWREDLMKRVVRAGSPEIVKIAGSDSSPCSAAETSFRELDDVFLQVLVLFFFFSLSNLIWTAVHFSFYFWKFDLFS